MGLTGGSALFSVLMLWLVLRGGMMSSMLLFELIAITIAMVFLTNVHPSVRRRL